MTEEEADRLLRSDLMKLCKMFSGYGQDSLLLATLAYNVGAYRLLGYGDRPEHLSGIHHLPQVQR